MNLCCDFVGYRHLHVQIKNKKKVGASLCYLKFTYMAPETLDPTLPIMHFSIPGEVHTTLSDHSIIYPFLPHTDMNLLDQVTLPFSLCNLLGPR